MTLNSADASQSAIRNSQSAIEVSAIRNPQLEDAYEHCKRIACSHYENFPVGSVVVPHRHRRHFYSVYSFARGADDFADEGVLSKEERLEKLEGWRSALEAGIKGEASHPVFIALAQTIKERELPARLFHDLIDAFSLDVVRSRHDSFEDLLDYSRCSANPVGRLILLLFGHRDEALHKLSDAICTALQLTNFWQDVLVDLEKDRIYIPQEYFARFGYSEQDLREHRYNENYIAMMESLAARTEALFMQGKPLCRMAGGRLGIELRLVWTGGMSILNALRRERFNIFAHRPALGAIDKIKIFLSAFFSL